MNRKIPTLFSIMCVLLISGCSQTGEIVEKSEQTQEDKQTSIETPETTQELVSCDNAEFIIQGMSFEESGAISSIKIIVANTGQKDLTINARIKYLDAQFEIRESIGTVEANSNYNEFSVLDVNEDIDKVFLYSEECPEVSDYIIRNNIVGLNMVNEENTEQVETEDEWYIVEEFSGDSNRVTDTFSIKGNKWRFTWECIEDTTYGSGFGGMNIFAMPEDDYTLIGESIFMGKCEGSDTTYVHEGPGKYYLDIDVANVIDWSVLVEDYY